MSAAAESSPRRPRLSAAFRSYSNSRLSRASPAPAPASASALSSQTSSVGNSSSGLGSGSSSRSARQRSHTLSTPSTAPVAVDQTPLSAPSTPGIGTGSLTAPFAMSFTGESTAVSGIAGNTANGAASGLDEEPSIRLSPYIDHSSSTPALYFEPIERKGRQGTYIRLGRYTDKKQTPQAEACYAPVVFKSKVVSRTHAELWAENGQWFVKDVKSSSGTFLNRIRLSPANTASQAFPLNDGDILQLGMDFRGGSEEVYKCVKMRVEINRSWQKRINNFNASAHIRLRSLTLAERSAAHGQQQECAICLVAVAPCQALFVAPCSHVWHYKCIRPIIIRDYPQFLCPNCRAVCDLEADVDTPDLTAALESLSTASKPEVIAEQADQDENSNPTSDSFGAVLPSGSSGSSTSDQVQAHNPTLSEKHAPSSALGYETDDALAASTSDDPDVGVGEAGESGSGVSGSVEFYSAYDQMVLTPTNEAGPFVFDNMVVDSPEMSAH
ncbi:uncharacterized protein V1516DRAFT_680502 [Lipomyces oligophaga]|uniref:uncharacterized protein n=1 Tax=Lipomyces oligophaga TaxID=45792 RepID=UPI0034D01E0E